ncbi:MAG: hypothetical protein MI739_05425 [Bacteroidales bacterium]|nr:hypothetical protein [Bacteroidales bacterium]
MKRVLGVILSVIYFLLSTSAAISMHYCRGELKNIDFYSQINVCCCDQDTPNACCENDTFVLKLETDQNCVSENRILPKQVVLSIIQGNNIEIITEAEHSNTYYPIVVLPPKLEPIWLLNCSLTFYG